MARRSVLLLIVALACGGGPAPAPPDAVDESAFDPPAALLATAGGQLQVFVPTALSDGRRVRVRGMVRNPYPQRVDGIRLTLRLLSHEGTGAEERDRFQRVLDVRLEPNTATSLHWDVESSYADVTGAGGLDLRAFAVRRGDEPIPPPPGWRR